MARLLPVGERRRTSRSWCCGVKSRCCSGNLSGRGCGSRRRIARLLAALLMSVPRSVLGRLRLLVRPDAVLGWHRGLVKRRHAVRSRHKRAWSAVHGRVDQEAAADPLGRRALRQDPDRRSRRTSRTRAAAPRSRLCARLWVPVIRLRCSGGVFVLVLGAAESVVSSDVEMEDPGLVGDRFGCGT